MRVLFSLPGGGVGAQDVIVELRVSLPVHAVQEPEHGHHLLYPVHADEHGKVIVELPGLLVAHVNEEHLLRVHGHGHRDLGGQVRHALVLQDLGVHPPEAGVVEHRDEPQGVARGRNVHLPARLVRLRLDAPVPYRPVLFLDVALGEIQTLDEVGVVPLPGHGELALESVARHPVGEVLGAEEVPDADGAHDLAGRQEADLGIGVGETAVPEQRVAVQAAGRHGELQLGGFQLVLDGAEGLGGGARGVQVVFGVLGVPGHQVVVVGRCIVDELLFLGLYEQLADLHRGNAVHDGGAEGVAHGIGHAPERHRQLAVLHRLVSPSLFRGSHASHLLESCENIRARESGFPHWRQRRRNGRIRRRCQITTTTARAATRMR